MKEDRHRGEIKRGVKSVKKEKNRDNKRSKQGGEERQLKGEEESLGEEVRLSHVGVDVQHPHCAGSSLLLTRTPQVKRCVCVCLHHQLCPSSP